MKHFITIISVIIASFITFTVSAQDRVNRAKLTYTSESETLTNVTGWGFDNEAGEWVESKNYIETIKRYKTVFNDDTEHISHKDNNIISIQFKTVNYNNTLYYVLVWEKWGGRYLYPSIYEDWIYYKVKKFMIFSEEEMNNLHNLTNDVSKFKVPTFTKDRYNDDVEDVDIIQTGLGESYNSKEMLKIYKATDGSIRFAVGDMNMEKAYFEISEGEYNGLTTL